MSCGLGISLITGFCSLGIVLLLSTSSSNAKSLKLSSPDFFPIPVQ